MKKIVVTCLFLLPILFILPLQGLAEDKKDDLTSEEIFNERMALYKKAEAHSHIPWYYYAAVDSYERGLRQARKDRPKEDGFIAIYIPQQKWVGELNPNEEDKYALSISFFDGFGRDGNGDGLADINNDEDILFSFAEHLTKFGSNEEDIRIGLWDYYQRDKAVELITGHAKVYKKFNTLDLREKSFIVPLHFNYSYKSTFGDARGWGGRRIHEGTDIFADHGTPVKSTTYGVVELKGWNKYGGWRIGIRDKDNVYHYYAHLSRFEDGIDRGAIVEPGTVIGYVGSTGYGKPGTSGKFPPHLHYGVYRDNGIIEWSFDPYPQLRQLEQKERKKKRG
ncbi:M23 family metallopeptidase [Evansella cellulosilytica]|uniref:Peptidase M23 n=1 Tax=Evansella cellulosilytica (strain ATCC 21833 / DSM 2522 / FERM P-1141 / JCM 9156 / N-4) TaxID=649639 RepID=E6U2F1_EVAC2|nr:peptidoglycan DD-metalloendopeptidase family protein [Evansella cellulosilytica]ADU31664.1 Peptidase M23 [Evansella cellulosilytica DSM 2522]